MALNRRYGGHDMGMDMGNMNTGTGVPGFFYMQKMLWAVIGAAIAFAALINVCNNVLLWQRLRSGNAKPRSLPWSWYATAIAITRESYSSSLPTYRFGTLRLRSPPLGKTIVALSWLTVIFVFCFLGYDTTDQWSWEDIAYRCGCVAQSQLPLVFLLAGKQNIIGYLIGSSYERLNWLHRWVARVLWITVTMHMGFWFRSWARYDYILVKLKTDSMTQTGFAAWCILTAVLVTSLLPVRRLNYEVFVALHLILFAGLTGAIYIHVDYGQAYIWWCVSIFFLDRFLRILVTLWANLPLLHAKPGLLANQATLTPLPGNVTRITIDRPVVRWQPGQHMFLSCHAVVPLQTHPFTAASLPSDGKLEFLVQAQNGGTRRMHRWASKYHRLPDTETPMNSLRKYVGLEGPYGSIRPLRQFDSVVLFAGSTGASFTTPLMRDIVRRWKETPYRIVTKRVKYVWVIKSRDRLCWFQEQLQQAMADVADMSLQREGCDLELGISVYITCDEKLEETSSGTVCAPSEHGEAEAYQQPESEDATTEKKNSDDTVAVRPVPSSSSSIGCAPDGGCCCKKAVDESGISPVCCCKRTTATPDSDSASMVNEKQIPQIRQPLKLRTGRPKVKPIIRRVLEEAEGESAVVVCGPQGLQDDVRHSIVTLSDERAVHKGTGAQGVFLHMEGFCY